MSIFNKRPLSIIFSLMLGGFVIFTESGNLIRVILIIASFLPCFISFILKFNKTNRAYSFLLSTLLLITFLFSHLYFDLGFRAYSRFRGENEITARVEQIKPSSSYSTGVVVSSKTINGKRAGGCRFICYLDSKSCDSLEVGDTVSFTAYLSDFDDKETRNYNFSRGISAKADSIDNFKTIQSSSFSLDKTFAQVREYISRYTAMISDKDSASLFSALLLGERQELSPQIRLDFKRIGISHILALSGMHLSILSLGINKLLILLGVKKKPRTAAVIFFVMLYMALTGFSVSVVRAGLMLIISSLLFLVSKSKDSITSLITAVFIICLITPYSIYDIALWLSAFATLGILILSEYLREVKLNSSYKKPFIYVYVSLLCSVFAISCTILISTLTFGGISLYSLFSTFIFSILIEVIMYLGCIMLVIGWVIPIKHLFIPLCNFTAKLAELLSSSKYAYISNKGTLSIILVLLLTVIIAVFAFFNIRNKKRFIIIICSCFILTTVTPFIQAFISSKSTESVIYYSKSKCDEFLIRSNSEVCLINSSQYSKSNAYKTKDLLDEYGVTWIDKYVVTHYGFNLTEDFEVIFSNFMTKCIYIPKPQNQDEKSILSIIEKRLSEYTTDIILYDLHASLRLGKVIMTPMINTAYGEGSSINAFSLYSYGNTMLYISSGVLDRHDKELYYDYLSCSDQIIFGAHGKKYKEKLYLSNTDIRARRIIFGSPNLYLTQQEMITQTEKGCEILSHPSKVELLE